MCSQILPESGRPGQPHTSLRRVLLECGFSPPPLIYPLASAFYQLPKPRAPPLGEEDWSYSIRGLKNNPLASRKCRRPPSCFWSLPPVSLLYLKDHSPTAPSEPTLQAPSPCYQACPPAPRHHSAIGHFRSTPHSIIIS